MIDIEVDATRNVRVCLLVLGLAHSLAITERLKEIFSDVWALLHRQNVVGCDVLEDFFARAVAISDEIEFTAKIVRLDGDTECVGGAHILLLEASCLECTLTKETMLVWIGPSIGTVVSGREYELKYTGVNSDHNHSVFCGSSNIKESAMKDDDLAEIEKKIDQIDRENERLRERFEYLDENTVLVTAVERVLLEYGLPPEKVDTIIDDIRAVDRAVDRNNRGDE